MLKCLVTINSSKTMRFMKAVCKMVVLPHNLYCENSMFLLHYIQLILILSEQLHCCPAPKPQLLSIKIWLCLWAVREIRLLWPPPCAVMPNLWIALQKSLPPIHILHEGFLPSSKFRNWNLRYEFFVTAGADLYFMESYVFWAL